MRSKPYTRKNIVLSLMIPSFIFIIMTLVYAFYFYDPERLRNTSYKGDDVTEVFYYAQKVFRGEIPEKETKGTPWSQYNQADLINKSDANVNAVFNAEEVQTLDDKKIITVSYWTKISSQIYSTYYEKGRYSSPDYAQWTIEYNSSTDWKLVSVEDNSR